MNARVHLSKRITARDLADYISRRLSSKDIAEMYSTDPIYVTRALPKREYNNRKQYKAKLRATREEFRNGLARKVIDKTLAVEDAADTAHCSIRTMFRHVKKVRLTMPATAQVTESAARTNPMARPASEATAHLHIAIIDTRLVPVPEQAEM